MVSSGHYKNENLIKLKELSDKICSSDFSQDDEESDYKEVVGEIVNIIENSNDIIEEQENDDKKLKCYEAMCGELKKILTKIKTNLK